MSRSRVLLFVISTTLFVALGAFPPGSQAAGSSSVCQDPRAQITKETSGGTKVWIPSSRSAGPFQFGGSQSISYADGELTATTKGTADTVGGTGGVNIGVVEASATYDRQWNRSTTHEKSFSRTFTTNSPSMPRDVNWRWRMYSRGYRFLITKKCRIPTPWVDADEDFVTRKVIVPITSTTYTFHVERYRQRNWMLTMDGTPIRR